MFCYYESGRHTWAVRNDGGVLVARFVTEAQARDFLRQFQPVDPKVSPCAAA